MKKHVLTGLAALTLLDISAEMAAAQNWAGAYVGGHLGYRSGDAGLTAPAFTLPDGSGGSFSFPARSDGPNPDDLIGGAHAGYNFMLQPNVLVGVEADFTLGSASDSTIASFLSTDGVTARRTSTVKLGWQSTVRGRLGYVTGPWLIYLTGGVAFARIDWSDLIALPATSFAATSRDTRTGYTVGAGFEYFWGPNCTVRVQYLYADFGNDNVPLAGTAQAGSLSVASHTLLFGASRKF